MAFSQLGLHKHELDSFYAKLENDVEVIDALENQAAEKNLVFPLKEKVDTIQYEFRSAARAHLDWQPSKVWVFFIAVFSFFKGYEQWKFRFHY